MKTLTNILLLAALCIPCSPGLMAQPLADSFQYFVDTTFAAHPSATAIMVSVATADNKIWSYAAGVSDKRTNEKVNAAQPVITASNTKPYVAATILRLQEQHKLNIYDAVGKHLPRGTVKKLIADGYDTEAIKIAHLLSHTSGIHDFVNDEWFDYITEHKQHHWTRDEQVARALKIGNPLAAAGDTFKYADINYLLLTEIIEEKTGKPFYESVRKLLKYKELKLNSTWFRPLEATPKNSLPMVHQYWSKRGWDALDFEPSWDLYGGGGIAATTADLALFFKYLFEGEIIKDTAVLAKMYSPVMGVKAKTNYCLGLRKINIAGHTGYYHGGFLGTDVVYFPDLKTAVAIVISEREGREPLSAGISKAIVELLEKEVLSR